MTQEEFEKRIKALVDKKMQFSRKLENCKMNTLSAIQYNQTKCAWMKMVKCAGLAECLLVETLQKGLILW